MSGSVKSLSEEKSYFPGAQALPHDLQINFSPDLPSPPARIPAAAPRPAGLWQDILSFTRSGIFGLAKLFATDPEVPPAAPLAANLTANPTSIYFGQLSIHSSASRSFIVTNNGDRDAQVSFTTARPFNVSGGGTLKPRASAYFTVSFNPTRAGTFQAFVTGSYGISIALNGTARDPYKK